MPRIKLAHWHDGHAPGDETDVTDEQLKALIRDGRVAEVVDDAAAAEITPAPEAPAVDPQPETAVEDGDTGQRRKGRG